MMLGGNPASGTTTTSHVTGDDVIAQAIGNAQNAPKYLLYDGLGSTRQLMDSTGATVDASYSYDTYGVMLGGNPGANGTLRAGW